MPHALASCYTSDSILHFSSIQYVTYLGITYQTVRDMRRFFAA